jgi:hypothetical protein
VRLLVLAVSLGLLVVVSVLVTSSPLPAPASNSLWFYSALLALLLGDLIVEPWYTSPADAVANAAAVILSTIAASSAGLEVSPHAFTVGRTACLVVAGLILALAAIAMLTRRPPSNHQSYLHRVAFAAAVNFGRARVLFASFYAVTAAAAFAHTPSKLLALYLFGTILLWANPVETVVRRVAGLRREKHAARAVVTAVAEPLTAFLGDGVPATAVVGGTVLRDGQRVGTIVALSHASESRVAEVVLAPNVQVREGGLLEVGAPTESPSPIVGPVGRDTALDRIVVRSSGVRLDEVELARIMQ